MNHRKAFLISLISDAEGALADVCPQHCVIFCFKLCQIHGPIEIICGYSHSSGSWAARHHTAKGVRWTGGHWEAFVRGWLVDRLLLQPHSSLDWVFSRLNDRCISIVRWGLWFSIDFRRLHSSQLVLGLLIEKGRLRPKIGFARMKLVLLIILAFWTDHVNAHDIWRLLLLGDFLFFNLLYILILINSLRASDNIWLLISELGLFCSHRHIFCLELLLSEFCRFFNSLLGQNWSLSITSDGHHWFHLELSVDINLTIWLC